MAVATYTSSVWLNTPKANQFGNNSVSGVVNWTAAGTVGDVVFLAKVPNGAKIVDFYEYHTSGQTAAAISFGFDRGIASGGAGNASCLLSSGAIATMNRMTLAASPNTNNAPVTISISDLDPIHYVSLTAKAESGTFTLTVAISFCLTYRVDGPDTV
jgi:hypothetical protein